jgi:hypothetical protein
MKPTKPTNIKLIFIQKTGESKLKLHLKFQIDTRLIK